MWTLFWMGLTALGVFGAFKFLKLNAESDKMIPDVKFRIHKLEFTGITFGIDVSIKNPSPLRMSIVQPFLTINYTRMEGKGDGAKKVTDVIASSNVGDNILTIEPFSTTTFKTIFLKASYLKSVKAVAKILKKLTEKNKTAGDKGEKNKEDEDPITLNAVLSTYVVLDKNPKKRLKDYAETEKPSLVPYTKEIPKEF